MSHYQNTSTRAPSQLKMESLKEILPFLSIGARLDLKAVATKHILDMTGNPDSSALILDIPQILTNLIMLTHDSNESIAKDAFLALINVSSTESGAKTVITLKLETNPLLKPPENIIKTCLTQITNPRSKYADPACMILSNLSRHSTIIEQVIDLIIAAVKLDELVTIFTRIGYNQNGAHLHYLGPFFSNLSQSFRVRHYLLDKEKCVIQRLLPFTEYEASNVRRGGIIATLKNICFENDYHEWLLSPDVDLLPRLLLPLAGAEEFDDEDNDKLPNELQYLEPGKCREPDPDLRCMLLEAVTQLCATKKCRTLIRDKNTYIILRELHKWEKDKKCLLACENLVDLLIRTEDEINQDNLKDVDVPEDLTEKFTKMDDEFLNV